MPVNAWWSVVLLKLHGCVVSHMQVLATTLLSVHNIKNSFLLDPYSWKNLILATCFWGSDVAM